MVEEFDDVDDMRKTKYIPNSIERKKTPSKVPQLNLNVSNLEYVPCLRQRYIRSPKSQTKRMLRPESIKFCNIVGIILDADDEECFFPVIVSDYKTAIYHVVLWNTCTF